MKQAVVLIHGIGEQKPMDTLRGFVSAVLKPAPAGKEQFWSKPDPLSCLFELRRLQSTGRTKTHFYEYYWAYHVEGTKLSHLGRWFFDLLLRRPRDVPSSLTVVWALFWVFTLSLAGLVVSGVATQYYLQYDQLKPYQLSWIASIGAIAILQTMLIAYMGDAARYLSSHPQNIALRQKIRADGVALLKQLHEVGKYDRIIVVGHSLGSVIAYDIMSRLWSEYNEQYDFRARENELEAMLAAGQAPQPNVRHNLYQSGLLLNTNSPAPNVNDPKDPLTLFRQAQVQAWKEQKHWGNPWRISDFVSIGSPLAHALLLLASDQQEFEQRKRQRELPTCPPTKEGKGYAYAHSNNLHLKSGKIFTPLTLHHAAPFAVTRWTNLYFPAFFGLFGDLIGGPMRAVFGWGIQDVPVKLNSWRRFTPLAHTAYWNIEATQVPDDSTENTGTTEGKPTVDKPMTHLQNLTETGLALPELRRALNLEEIRLFK